MSRVFSSMMVAVPTLVCFVGLQSSRTSQPALASSSQEVQDSFRADVPEGCPVTNPPSQPFVPPPPYWTNHGPNQFWYGTESLWTLLSVPGTCAWHIRSNVLESKGAYRTNLSYWRRGFNWRKEREPKLVINARRLDHDARVIVIVHANAVFVTGPAPAAMMTAIDIPTAGCWEITAKYKDQKLSFVVSLQP